MTQHKLQFQDVSGKTITFVDPLNIGNAFVHKTEKVRKNISGVGRVLFHRNEFAQTRQYDVAQCGPVKCGVKDDTHTRVILSGVDKEAMLKNWADMKANVDIAIASGALDGLRLPLTLSTLVITDDPVVVP